MKDIKVKPVVFAMAQELARVMKTKDSKIKDPNDLVTYLIEKEYKERKL